MTPPSAVLHAINAAVPTELAIGDELVTSGIDKRPRAGGAHITMDGIEGDFIANMLNNSKDKTFVTSIRSLAREMGITVVAEFVESAEVLAELEALEVHRAQGYYIGRPGPGLLPADWAPAG